MRAALLAMPGVDAGRLIYYGHSFGGATCIDLASTDPPTVLITESTFTSAQALITDGAGYDLPRSFLTTLHFDSIEKIPHVFVPYLAIHGLADDYVQPKYSIELTRAHAGAGPTQLELVPGADHGGSPTTLGLDAYRALVGTFVDANLPR